MSLRDRIKDVVDWEIPALKANDTLHTAISQMAKLDVSALVVEMNGETVGILCDSDLLQSVIRGENLDEVSVAEVMTACDLMTEKGAVNPCAQIYEMESIKNGLKVLEASGTHNLMVAGSNRPKAGLVSIRSLLKAAIK